MRRRTRRCSASRALAFYERMGFERIGSYRFHIGARAYDDYLVALRLRD